MDADQERIEHLEDSVLRLAQLVDFLALVALIPDEYAHVRKWAKELLHGESKRAAERRSVRLHAIRDRTDLTLDEKLALTRTEIEASFQ